MPDESAAEDCYRLVQKLGIAERLPESIRAILNERRIQETPKPGEGAFARSSWHSLLDNAAALEAISRRASDSGWILETDLSVDDKPVADAADRLIDRLGALKQANPDRTVAVLTGGELSSPVTGDGMGGRNSAFVLDCVPKIAARPITVVSAGTDGIDGNSPAAGAVADGHTLARAESLGLDAADYALRSDAFRFFDQLGDALVTGPTGNNVRDIRLLVAE
jgi:hydroxypyruvate reductase